MNEINRKPAYTHRGRIGKHPSAPENWPAIMERAVEGGKGGGECVLVCRSPRLSWRCGARWRDGGAARERTRSAEREFPASLVFWAYQQKSAF